MSTPQAQGTCVSQELLSSAAARPWYRPGRGRPCRPPRPSPGFRCFRASRLCPGPRASLGSRSACRHRVSLVPFVWNTFQPSLFPCPWCWGAAGWLSSGSPRSPCSGFVGCSLMLRFWLCGPHFPGRTAPPEEQEPPSSGCRGAGGGLTRPHGPPLPPPTQAVCPGHRRGQHGPQGHGPALHCGQGKGAAGLQVSDVSPHPGSRGGCAAPC